MGLVFGVGCVEASSGALRCWSLFFRLVSDAVFLDFWWILDGFGRPKWCRKSIFGRFFSTLLSKTISASILDGFSEAPNVKNSNFP